MKIIKFIKDFSLFLLDRKKWWLVPILIFLLLFGTLSIVREGSAAAPLLYALF